METKIKISASIVLYKEDFEELKKTINCFLAIPLAKKLFLIDNTKNSLFRDKFKKDEIVYIENKVNIGFGAAHNKILDKIEHLSKYHLILNPDVTFNKDVIPNLINELKKNTEVAMIAPKVLFPNKTHQYSCRRYPTLMELFIRRIKIIKPLFKQQLHKGEYRDMDLNIPFHPESLTGCFHLYNTNDLINLKGFDERYFLYMEDVDICKKIDLSGKKKLYFPDVKIIHIANFGSAKEIRLLIYHISSAFKYFRKWGF